MIPSYIVHFPAANLQLGLRPAFHTRPCPSSYIWTVVIFELKKNFQGVRVHEGTRSIQHSASTYDEFLTCNLHIINCWWNIACCTIITCNLSLLIPLTVSHVKSPYGFHLSNTLMKLAKHKPWTPMATALHWQVVEVGECFRRTRVLSHVWSKEWPFWVWRRFFWVLLM